MVSLGAPRRQAIRLEVVFKDSKNDVVCSPIAVLMPLAKIALGAEGTALDELEAGIGVYQSDMPAKVKHILNKLDGIDGIELTLISKIYVSKNLKVLSNYQSLVREIFRTKIEYIDFPYEHAANTINKWIKYKTVGKITDIVTSKDLESVTALLMISVINFEGTWYKRFGSKDIRTFYSPKGKVRVPMMSKKDTLKYIDSSELKAKIISLPYKGFEAEFVIVLPDAYGGLKEMLELLKESGMTKLKDVMGSMTMESIDVSIPIFKTETTLDLKSILESMKIKEMFVTGLSGIVFNQAVVVSKAIQKTYIKVDQEGTSAASVSAIQIQLLSALVGPSKAFIANRPFLYILVAKGEQLFSGIYNGISVEPIPPEDYNSS